MIVAFHFRVGEPGNSNYGWPIEQQFFRHLLDSSEEESHLEIFVGDLLTQRYRGGSAKEDLLRELLGFDPRRWTSMDREEFASALGSSEIYVMAVEGLGIKGQDYLDSRLRRDHAYLGAMEINPANRVHRQLYRASLVPRYRYLNRDVRLFYRKFEYDAGGDVKDLGLADDLRSLPFRSVEWEDTGARCTIFDPYYSPEHDQRLTELRAYIAEHLARMADEILLRSAAVNPRLNETLHAAFKTFDRIQTEEDCAQVATSCRRFLDALSEALYPPQDKTPEGRNLGKAAYRNRLWAYVEEHLKGSGQKLALAQLDDVGNRIDSLDQLANKGLHARVTKSDIRRLIASMLILAYDLFSMSPPPLATPVDPYAETIVDFAKKVIGKGPLE